MSIYICKTFTTYFTTLAFFWYDPESVIISIVCYGIKLLIHPLSSAVIILFPGGMQIKLHLLITAEICTPVYTSGGCQMSLSAHRVVNYEV